MVCAEDVVIPLWARLMEANFVDCNCECHGGERQTNVVCCWRCAEDDRTALPVYFDTEVMMGRHQAFVPGWLFAATTDRAGHDPGDEDRRGS